MNLKTITITSIIVIILASGLLVWCSSPADLPTTAVSESSGTPRTTAVATAQLTPATVATDVPTITTTAILTSTEPSTPSTAAVSGATPQTASTEEVLPSATISRAEQIAKQLAESGGQFAASREQCGKILQTEDWCSVVQSAEQVSRPEWDVLFPDTEFYVVKRELYGGEFEPEQRNLLIIEQNGQRYGPENFHRLLNSNNITITDNNRELVAKSLVLMMLPDYLQDGMLFSEWGEDDVPAAYGLRFNYGVSVWTKLQGLRLRIWFLFEEEYLLMVEGVIKAHHVGDYINSSSTYLSTPNSSFSYSYRR